MNLFLRSDCRRRLQICIVLASATIAMSSANSLAAPGKSLVDAASRYALELGCLPAAETPDSAAQVWSGDGSFIRADSGWSHFRPSTNGSSTVIVVQGQMDIGEGQSLIACVALVAPSNLAGGTQWQTRFENDGSDNRPSDGAAAMFRLEFEGEAFAMAAATGQLTIDYADDNVIKGAVTFNGPAWDPQAKQFVKESPSATHAVFEARAQGSSGRTAATAKTLNTARNPQIAAFNRYVDCSTQMQQSEDPLAAAKPCWGATNWAEMSAHGGANWLRSSRGTDLELISSQATGSDVIELHVKANVNGPAGIIVKMQQSEDGWRIVHESLNVPSGLLSEPIDGPGLEFELRENGRLLLTNQNAVWQDAGTLISGQFETIHLVPLFTGPTIQLDNLRLTTPSQGTLDSRDVGQLEANPNLVSIRYKTATGSTRVLGGRLEIEKVEDDRLTGLIHLKVKPNYRQGDAPENVSVELKFRNLPLGEA